jgi:hypothetical protein
MIAGHKIADNSEYMEILESELPKKDLEGQTIGVSKNLTLEIRKG